MISNGPSMHTRTSEKCYRLGSEAIKWDMIPDETYTRGATYDDFSGQFFLIFESIIFAVLLVYVT